jgi:hypothetical protein
MHCHNSCLFFASLLHSFTVLAAQLAWLIFSCRLALHKYSAAAQLYGKLSSKDLAAISVMAVDQVIAPMVAIIGTASGSAQRVVDLIAGADIGANVSVSAGRFGSADSEACIGSNTAL